MPTNIHPRLHSASTGIRTDHLPQVPLTFKNNKPGLLLPESKAYGVIARSSSDINDKRISSLKKRFENAVKLNLIETKQLRPVASVSLI